MNAKFVIFASLFLGMSSGAFPAEESGVDVSSGVNVTAIAIAFLVICIIVFFISLILLVIFHRRKSQRHMWEETSIVREERRSRKYTMSHGYDCRQELSNGDHPPQQKKTNEMEEENGGYMTMEGGSLKEKDQEKDQHVYEPLKSNGKTLDKNENAYEMTERDGRNKRDGENSDIGLENVYDNPGEIVDEVKGDSKKELAGQVGSDNTEYYPMADANVSVRGPAYENPVVVNDKGETEL